jgi:transposase
MKLTDHELRKHYGLLLGIELPWQVEEVHLDLEGKQVEIRLGWSSGHKGKCPVCGQACAQYDLAPERPWRHLDTMQFETIIRARVPRVECPTDGVKTLEVPWAEPHGRFSQLFERLAIDVLLCARSIKGAAALMDLSCGGRSSGVCRVGSWKVWFIWELMRRVLWRATRIFRC